MSAESKPGRFPELLRVRCPRPLPALIERTAERQFVQADRVIAWLDQCGYVIVDKDALQASEMEGSTERKS